MQLIGSVQKGENVGEFELLCLRIGEDEDVRVLVGSGQGGVNSRVDEDGAVLKWKEWTLLFTQKYFLCQFIPSKLANSVLFLRDVYVSHYLSILKSFELFIFIIRVISYASNIFMKLPVLVSFRKP